MRRPPLAALVVIVAATLVPAVAAAAAAPASPVAPAARLADPGFTRELQHTAGILPARVHIAGVDVGGLQADAALTFVKASFAQPLVVVLAGRRIRVAPADLGAVAYAGQAVRRALAVSPGHRVDLTVRVPGAGVRAFVNRLATRFDRTAKARKLALRNFRPVLTVGVVGRRIDRNRAIAAIVRGLTSGSRKDVALAVLTVKPAVPAVASTQLIVVRRASNALELFDGVKLVRRFAVATGQSAYPTPLGTFQIIVKQRDPWWYPPASPWAKGEEPVPPGPGNPLGTRWMGLSAPLVGIHGTNNPASLGYSRSHGCIRMRIDQAEWLFERVDVGTKVMIVPA